MATWEYCELLAEAITVSDDGQWVTKTAMTFNGPGGPPKSVPGSSVYCLNRLGAADWELVGVTRVQIEEQFQIKVITTYVLKRPRRRRVRRGDHLETVPA